MTRSEAERECQRLAEEHPDRATHQWRPRADGEDGWSIVKIGVPPGRGVNQTELQADEKPPTPDDPRSAYDRNVGGPWVGGI